MVVRVLVLWTLIVALQAGNAFGKEKDVLKGVFFEGAITAGCADGDTVDNAIQANIVAAGYGK